MTTEQPAEAPTLTPAMKDFLPTWLAEQRWYAGKGRRPQLRRLGGFRFEDPDGEVGVETHLTADVSTRPPVVYQVPLSYRAEPLPGAEHALVATTVHSELGKRWIYDATHDPAYVKALLDLVLGSGSVALDEPVTTRVFGGDPGGGAPRVVGHHTSGPTDVALTSSSVLRGEQSNTSIICRVHDPSGTPAEPIILKVFRTLQAGDNPDVVVQSALTAAGSTQVPETIGYVSGHWLAPDHVEARARHEADIDSRLKAAVTARTRVTSQIHKDRAAAAAAHAGEKARVARERVLEIGRRREAVRPTLREALLGDKDQLERAIDTAGLPDPDAVPAPLLPTRELPRIPGRSEFPEFVPQVVGGHLAFAQRFFPGVEDAWRVALRAAGSRTDFTMQADELGEATARIHVTLAEALGTVAASDDAKQVLLRSIRTRYASALGELPALAGHERAIHAIIDAFGRQPWADLQRVHGDYHLGQVLRVAGRGWVAVDFEGEPLRPLAERVRPDLALRDVAGMLRSFDYAGGSVELAHPGTSARAWVEDCRGAFLDGYARVTRLEVRAAAPMIRALELDKALYEVAYEARNRPTWLSIPATAIDRLIADSKGSS